jgi:HSP20 family molecular chaperone IbpA
MSSGRLTLFDSPLFLGFDQLEETFERLRKSAGDGYPPYNIEQTGDTTLRITLAVAGFTMDDLDVEVEQTQLVIRGKQEDDKQRVYLHRGIAARQFQRAFVLADGIEVRGASMDNGLLHIDLERVVPERSARKIKINTGKESREGAQAIDVESREVPTKRK